MNPGFDLLGVETPLFAFSAVPFVLVVAAALLYHRACSVLAGRGRHISVGQRVCYYAGLFLLLLATQTFIDPVGERSLLSAHMLQHLLIADLPAPLLLVGIRAPLLYFFWPAPVLKTVARVRPLRAIWAWLRRPAVALCVWLLTLYAWHTPYFYGAALEHRLVHDFEHLSFTLTGVLAYWPLLDPTHHRVEGRVWKAVYVFAARTVGGVLGIIITTWPTQLYGFYGSRARDYGMSVITDQRIAGGMMMMVDSAVVLIGVTYFLVTTGRGLEHADDMPESARAAYLERDRLGG
ncbi:MAG: Cytochrome c oxidase caa3-type, assembly factor CtaG-related protein [Thermoleophilia bacterium]|nr:Cytochrome c oxidase caa3-type, assembly factor CtaG-related protein [Thermoleophilia bacterium]